MHFPQKITSAQKMFFFLWALYDEISKVSMSRELYIVLNWLNFQDDRKTHLSISIWHNI